MRVMATGLIDKVSNILRKSDGVYRTLLFLGLTSISSFVAFGFWKWNWLDQGKRVLGFNKGKRRKKDGAVNIGGWCDKLNKFLL